MESTSTLGRICTQLIKTTATGLSPFEASLGYSPPLLYFQSKKLTSVHLRRWRKVWRQTKAALLRIVEQNKRFADQHQSTAPKYQLGNKVCLFTKYIKLKDTPRKIAPRFTGPFSITKIINPSAVRLQLPSSEKPSHCPRFPSQASLVKPSEPSYQPFPPPV